MTDPDDLDGRDALLARAFAPGEPTLSDAERTRLAELLRARPAPTAPIVEPVSPDASPDAAPLAADTTQVSAAPAPTPPQPRTRTRSRRGLVPVVVASGILLALVFGAGLLTGRAAGQSAAEPTPTPTPAPTFAPLDGYPPPDDAADYDPGSLYVAADLDGTAIWFGTKSDGRIVCIYVDEGTAAGKSTACGSPDTSTLELGFTSSPGGTLAESSKAPYAVKFSRGNPPAIVYRTDE